MHKRTTTGKEEGRCHGLTVVDNLLLRHLLFVVVENGPQRLGYPRNHAFTAGIKLGQVVGLLHQRIQSADLELRNGKGLDGPVVGVHRRTERRKSAISVASVEDAERERHDGILRHVAWRAR